MEKKGTGMTGGNSGTSRGSLRPYGATSRSHSFVVIGLIVVIGILGFNYYNAMKRNNQLTMDLITTNSLRKRNQAEKDQAELSLKTNEKQLTEEKSLHTDTKQHLEKVKSEIAQLHNDLQSLQQQVTDEKDNCRQQLSKEKENCLTAVADEKEECKNLLDTSIKKCKVQLTESAANVEQECKKNMEEICAQKLQEVQQGIKQQQDQNALNNQRQQQELLVQNRLAGNSLGNRQQPGALNRQEEFHSDNLKGSVQILNKKNLDSSVSKANQSEQQRVASELLEKNNNTEEQGKDSLVKTVDGFALFQRGGNENGEINRDIIANETIADGSQKINEQIQQRIADRIGNNVDEKGNYRGNNLLGGKDNTRVENFIPQGAAPKVNSNADELDNNVGNEKRNTDKGGLYDGKKENGTTSGVADKYAENAKENFDGENKANNEEERNLNAEDEDNKKIDEVERMDAEEREENGEANNEVEGRNERNVAAIEKSQGGNNIIGGNNIMGGNNVLDPRIQKDDGKMVGPPPSMAKERSMNIGDSRVQGGARGYAAGSV